MSRLARFLSNLFRLIFSGKFLEALFEIGLHLPDWLFSFNRGYALKAPIDQIDASVNDFEGYRVLKADEDSIETIFTVSRIGEERIRYSLKNGVSCFIASAPGVDWSSIGWFAYGKCYVRGMGLTYDFGNNPYTFGLYTNEGSRRKGLNRLIIAASIDEAKERGSSTVYSLVEFANHYALTFHIKLGYRVFLKVFYMKVFGLRMNHVRNLDTDQGRWRVFFAEPRSDVTLI